MCWSGEASFALAAVGLATTASAALNKEKKELFLPLFWFSLMELLQGFTYMYIDMCSNETNQLLTLLGYLHIAFQPFFANMISMYFLPEHVSKKVSPWVYSLCLAGTIAMIINVYPFSWGVPDSRNFLADDHICSVTGSWHIAWHIPVFGTVNFPIPGGWYMFLVFILPAVYGSWKFTTYHIFSGLFLSVLLTTDFHETAAVWCLLSIGLLAVVAKTRIRNLLFVKNWYGFEYPFKKED